MDPNLLARVTLWVEAYTTSLETIRQGLITALLRLFMVRSIGQPTPRGALVVPSRPLTPVGDLTVPARPVPPLSVPLVERSAEALRGPELSVWYDTDATEQVAKQAAAMSQRAQYAVQGVSAQYVANVHAELSGDPLVSKRVKLPPIRGGADMTEVYQRPVEAFQRRMSTTGDEQIATHAALARVEELAEGDVMLTARDSEHAQMKAHGVKLYRRVLHPARNDSGLSCGMCIVASTRVYKIETLQPLHLRCKCTVLEIAGSVDPGNLLNEADRALLDRLYAEAGGTQRRELKETRYHINEHGEYGPVLTRRGTPFNTPKQIGQDDPIGRAVRELEKLRPTLTLLENKAAAGQNVESALSYQRERIAFLERIVTAA
jgi:hypothetical protein